MQNTFNHKKRPVSLRHVQLLQLLQPVQLVQFNRWQQGDAKTVHVIALFRLLHAEKKKITIEAHNPIVSRAKAPCKLIQVILDSRG